MMVGKGAVEESRAWPAPAWLICVHTPLLILCMVCGDAPPRLFCLQAPLLSVLLAAHADALLLWGQSAWMSMPVGKKLTSLGIKMHPKGVSNPLPADPPQSPVGHMANSQPPSFTYKEDLASNHFLSCCFPCRSFVLVHTLVFSIFALQGHLWSLLMYQKGD